MILTIRDIEMNINSAIIWMFVGSLVIGIYFNGMNVLADDFNHLYFSSTTLIYSALLMASLMCVLEVLMHYDHTNELNINYLITFLTLSVMMIFFLRQQVGVNDNQWLKRMISHHSTAITTSKKRLEKSKNKDVRKLASSIISQQEKEIKLMVSLLQDDD